MKQVVFSTSNEIKPKTIEVFYKQTKHDHFYFDRRMCKIIQKQKYKKHDAKS